MPRPAAVGLRRFRPRRLMGRRRRTPQGCLYLHRRYGRPERRELHGLQRQTPPGHAARPFGRGHSGGIRRTAPADNRTRLRRNHARLQRHVAPFQGRPRRLHYGCGHGRDSRTHGPSGRRGRGVEGIAQGASGAQRPIDEPCRHLPAYVHAGRQRGL